MRVTPASAAAWSARRLTSSSTSPHDPPIAQEPNPIALTRWPVFPNLRYSIACLRVPGRRTCSGCDRILGVSGPAGWEEEWRPGSGGHHRVFVSVVDLAGEGDRRVEEHQVPPRLRVSRATMAHELTAGTRRGAPRRTRRPGTEARRCPGWFAAPRSGRALSMR